MADLFKDADEFVNTLWNPAQGAAASIGLPPEALLAEAALETGWGKHIPRDRNVCSHNLFGIKAGPKWTGPVIANRTKEFVEGGFKSEVADFRVYFDYESGFRGYVAFLRTNKRYQAALFRAEKGDVRGFFEGLQQAGYATDPDYADKVIAIAEKVKKLRGKK